MTRRRRSTAQMSEEEKKIRRREQKKLSIRRARAKMSEADLEERRRKDRERYQNKKENGNLKKIQDYTPREQRQIRKIWREKARKKREKQKQNKNAQAFIELSTPSTSARSRASTGITVSKRNRRLLKAENVYLKKKVGLLESKLAKYRMRSVRTRKLTRTNEERHINEKIASKKSWETRKAIQDFLLDDEYSTSTSGKKETITRKKIKKQIRFLNDSLINLHKLFVKKTGIQISYETFRRYRPFWILFPKVAARNTCLCVIHANTNFVVQALNHAKIIPFKSTTELLKFVCCNNALSVCCLVGECPTCKDKSITPNDFDDNDSIVYERWVTKDVTVVIKGTSKKCKKTLKEKVQTTKKNLLHNLNSCLPTFIKHVANMIHQTKIIQEIKKEISPDIGLLHIDFSENYNCKYSQEVQSAHFGGSKPQLSLHTSVYYSTQLDNPDNFIRASSFCTVSENLRHDPVLICVHLQALSVKIKQLSPNLQHLHILSDGPSTQYRNKSMFNLIATYISKEFGVKTITWHYSERGHGKGAPDGVGGCIKRICDSHVARGNDVANLEEFISCLDTNCKNIEVYRINELLIPTIQQILDKSILRPFKGTRDIHQLTWNINEPEIIHARRLSCLKCSTQVKCSHFELGTIKIVNKPEALRCPNSPYPSEAPEMLEVLQIPVPPNSPNNSDASDTTVSISPGRSDRMTPEEGTNAFVQNVKPQKRNERVVNSGDSDSSIEFCPKKNIVLDICPSGKIQMMTLFFSIWSTEGYNLSVDIFLKYFFRILKSFYYFVKNN